MPGGVYVPNIEAGFMHAGAPELDRQLREGDGMLWPGDPALELRMGLITWNQTHWEPELGRRVRKGDIAARRYEVWRHTELGEDVMIGHWRLEEFDRILLDLAPMRLDSPGHVDTLAGIDAHNAQVEKDADDKLKDSMGELLEHAMKLHHDTTQPKNVFRQMPGQNPDKQD